VPLANTWLPWTTRAAFVVSEEWPRRYAACGEVRDTALCQAAATRRGRRDRGRRAHGLERPPGRPQGGPRRPINEPEERPDGAVA